MELQPVQQRQDFDFTEVSLHPARPAPRYTLNLQSLGQLERISKAQFLLSGITPHVNLNVDAVFKQWERSLRRPREQLIRLDR